MSIYRVRLAFPDEPVIILDYLTYEAAFTALDSNGYEHFHTASSGAEWFRRGEATLATISKA